MWPTNMNFNPQTMMNFMQSDNFSTMMTQMMSMFSGATSSGSSQQPTSIFPTSTSSPYPAVYDYPNAGSVLSPNHTLYTFISDTYGMISKYRSPVYQQPLSVTLGQNYNPYNSISSSSYNPLDWTKTNSYYTNGINPMMGMNTGMMGMNTGMNMSPTMTMNSGMYMNPSMTMNSSMGMNSTMPYNTVNNNYMSPIGSSLGPTNYTGTLGESLGYQIGSAYRNPTALQTGTVNTGVSTGTVNTGISSNGYNTGVVGSRTALGSGSVLTQADSADGQTGVADLISKYSQFLFGGVSSGSTANNSGILATPSTKDGDPDLTELIAKYSQFLFANKTATSTTADTTAAAPEVPEVVPETVPEVVPEVVPETPAATETVVEEPVVEPTV
ncbi:MAG: hypothetical protein A2Y25_06625 [Candidatus Melainabacteria bacterium GWF2_37_15]|nr:MAG: hypothetical protein A2Y25_06625 [Candidatus Melainabacteria bacterium GWF2_37_15]